MARTTTKGEVIRMTHTILAIDIGTQGTKTALLDRDMRILASAFEASRLIQPSPGVVWQEAEDIYGACVRTIREVLARPGIIPASVAAVGVDSQMAGIMGVSNSGGAITYYDSWLDSRCAPYMKRMREKAGRKVTEITGGPVTYTHGPKILWWKQEQPEWYAKIDKFVLPHGYVVGRMAGLAGDEIYFDHTCLQYSGFGDNQRKVWSDELLSLFDVDRKKFPRIVSPFDIVGKTTNVFSGESGLPSGIPVVAGGGDTACSIFGSGLFDRNLLFDIAGTASVMCSVVDRFVPDTEYETLTMMRSPVDGFWFPLAYINGGGLCLKWFRDRIAHTTYEALEAECPSIPPGSGGILFVPHFAGRVLPNNPDIKGSFIGLDWQHTDAHLFRAVMEGVAYEYRFYLSVLRKLFPENRFDTMYVAGGGAKSTVFNQIKADVLGVRVTPFLMSEAGLAGTAVIAGVGAGLFKDFREPIRQIMRGGQPLEPDAARHAAYAPFAAGYAKVIETLTPLYREGFSAMKSENAGDSHD
ncbi:MAG: FGGY family carbohydrate kinase [Clostridia bacterium]|nr:FGGY family carbohydrate kinase [Clostridia bacterium]